MSALIYVPEGGCLCIYDKSGNQSLATCVVRDGCSGCLFYRKFKDVCRVVACCKRERLDGKGVVFMANKLEGGER